MADREVDNPAKVNSDGVPDKITARTGTANDSNEDQGEQYVSLAGDKEELDYTKDWKEIKVADVPDVESPNGTSGADGDMGTPGY